MARLSNSRPESEIYESITRSIHEKVGSTYEGADSTINIISESISGEIVNLRRENERIFDANQLSNATGEDLTRIAYETYRLNRKPPSFARCSFRETNLHFYVDSGTFGEINGGVSITLPEGTLVSVTDSFLDDVVVYKIISTYELNSEENYAYCSAVALNPGRYANVTSNSLNFHSFTNYEDVLNGSLKVTNKLPIINGSDEESDNSLRYRASNYLQSVANKNSDAVLLKTLEVPGINEVRILTSYFGIGTTAIVAFGQGRELTKNVANLIESKVLELEMPGQNITVINGITVFIDFKIRLYIKAGLSRLEKENIRASIRRDVANLIKEKEFNNFVDLNEVSRIILNNFTDDKVIGFGNSTNNSSVFEEVFVRKTDRFDLFPEEKTPVIEDTIFLGREERISFGEIIVELEEDIRWVLLGKA